MAGSPDVSLRAFLCVVSMVGFGVDAVVVVLRHRSRSLSTSAKLCAFSAIIHTPFVLLPERSRLAWHSRLKSLRVSSQLRWAAELLFRAIGLVLSASLDLRRHGEGDVEGMGIGRGRADGGAGPGHRDVVNTGRGVLRIG